MNHPDALNLLDELFDGELPPALAADVDRHVQACSHCQAAMARRAALSRSLAGRPVRPPSDDFVRGVLRRIDAPQPGSRWLMPALTAGLAAAVAVIAIGLNTAPGEPAADPVVRMEQEGEATLTGQETARTVDADQVMLLAMED